MPAPKILVVYYSRSGTTRAVAKALSARLKSSFEEIVETRGHDGFLGYWRSIIEARRK
jgi:flavodoxin